jgi:hypothetical protein
VRRRERGRRSGWRQRQLASSRQASLESIDQVRQLSSGGESGDDGVARGAARGRLPARPTRKLRRRQRRASGRKTHAHKLISHLRRRAYFLACIDDEDGRCSCVPALMQRDDVRLICVIRHDDEPRILCQAAAPILLGGKMSAEEEIERRGLRINDVRLGLITQTNDDDKDGTERTVAVAPIASSQKIPLARRATLAYTHKCTELSLSPCFESKLGAGGGGCARLVCMCVRASPGVSASQACRAGQCGARAPVRVPT